MTYIDTTSADAIRGELEAAGWRLLERLELLPDQTFQIFAPPGH